MKVKVVEAVEGAQQQGFRVKQLLFISDTVSGGLLGCSLLKVLQSLNLAHIQSLRWRVHRKTCEWKRHPVSRRDIKKKLWHMAADLLRFCSHLKGWGRHGPSSASFSSSLRWRSQRAAAADHSYGSTGRATKILFHPIQNPEQNTSVYLKDWLHCRETKLFFCQVLIYDTRKMLLLNLIRVNNTSNILLWHNNEMQKT